MDSTKKPYDEKEIVAFNYDPYIPEILLQLKEKFGLKCFIETGTHKAGSARWFAKNFDEVCTVELLQEYFDISKQVLEGYDNVILQMGDSVEWIEKFVGICAKPCGIFLDAHWGKNPLLGELEAIEHSGEKPVIVIHDFYNPNHPDYQWDKYPEQKVYYRWDYIEKHIRRIYGDSGFEIMYNDQVGEIKIGCIFIMPKV